MPRNFRRHQLVFRSPSDASSDVQDVFTDHRAKVAAAAALREWTEPERATENSPAKMGMVSTSRRLIQPSLHFLQTVLSF